MNRIEYYDRLSEVRTKGNYEQWIKFFLVGIIEIAEEGTITLQKIMQIKKKSEDKNISYVALDKMREESGLKFSDTVLEKKYNTYMSQYK